MLRRRAAATLVVVLVAGCADPGAAPEDGSGGGTTGATVSGSTSSTTGATSSSTAATSTSTGDGGHGVGGDATSSGGSGGAQTGGGGQGGAGPICELGDHRCTGEHGKETQSCTGEGTWDAPELCAALCSAGGCVLPPSCTSDTRCGDNESCCASYLVEGGTFLRSYDDVTFNDDDFAATVSPFLLDRYEVTVERFQAWLDVYDDAGSRPSPGDGQNPNNPDDTGWDAAWNELLPADAAALELQIAEFPECVWASPDVQADQPMDCITWYEAQAFCIWDGGRLPTEAEWNYAAAGGDAQRVYPWSVPSTSEAISDGQAVYLQSVSDAVGAKSPAGDGRWGQADLAGNVWEWVQDWYRDPYSSSDCSDCADLVPSGLHAYRGGGYVSDEPLLVTSYREGGTPAAYFPSLGVRCARMP